MILATTANYVCKTGTHVHLSSSTDRDPRVLLWSTREGLTYYERGEWTSAVDVMGDTIVLASGTAAVVTQCDDEHGFTGLKITLGIWAGKYGWVRDTDVN
jgi:hypothetical protein